MKQPGVEIRPIVQITGTSEFSEVFFDGARTAPRTSSASPARAGRSRWARSRSSAAPRRSASSILFPNELAEIFAIAKRNGEARDPVMRQRTRRRLDRAADHALQRAPQLSDTRADGELRRAAMITKIYWATWHRELGKLAMDVLGPEAEIGEACPYELGALQRMFLFTRADTIYAGSNQIQRNIIARARARPAARAAVEPTHAHAADSAAGPRPARRQDRRSSPPRPAPGSASPRRSAASRKARA